MAALVLSTLGIVSYGLGFQFHIEHRVPIVMIKKDIDSLEKFFEKIFSWKIWSLPVYC